MSDENMPEDLLENPQSLVDEGLGEDSSIVESVSDFSKLQSGSYLSSQVEYDMENSMSEVNKNLVNFSHPMSLQSNNYIQSTYGKTEQQYQPRDLNYSQPKDQDKDDLELGRILARKGIFSSEDLTDENLFTSSKKTQNYQRTRRYQNNQTNVKDLNDPGLQENHCILRLPEHAAELIKTRIDKGEPLRMSVSPTGRYDYREYKITIEGLENPLVGLLAELPCVIEAHKTLNSDLLFKSADISQLMIAYEKDEADKVAETLKSQMWEWPDGITHGTKNIRKKRFKDFDIYTNEEIKDAERESLILMNGLVRDTYHFEVKTAQEVNDLVQNYRNGNIKERVIGPDEDVMVYINALKEQETEDMPDLSEIMFDSDLASIPNKFIYNNIKNRIFNK